MIRLLVLVVALAAATPATAHTRSQSASHWTVQGDEVRVRVEADAVDVTRLYARGGDAGLEETFRAHVGESFALTAGGQACGPAPAALQPAASGRVAAVLAFACPRGADLHHLAVRAAPFFIVAPSHLHFASFSGANGEGAEFVFTDTRRAADIILRPAGVAESAWAAFTRFIPVGAMHVWGGLDHVAFIVALTLLAGGWRRTMVAALGFTLGHSGTLILAALGVLAPHGPTVEALVGFTVAFVAIEASAGGRERLAKAAPTAAAVLCVLAASALAGWISLKALALVGLAIFVFAYPRGFPRQSTASATVIAATFGLIHGCGFAGALSELELPAPRVLSALAGFNVGVELGQLAVIAVALLVAESVQRWRPAVMRPGAEAVLACLFALGVYWFVSRTMTG